MKAISSCIWKVIFILVVMTITNLIIPKASASSDIGYIIKRGNFSLIIRFGMDMKFKNGEFSRPETTLMELTQWVWDHKDFLEKQNFSASYSPGNRIIARLEPFDGKSSNFKFVPGNGAKAIIADLTSLLSVPDVKKIDKNSGTLLFVYVKEYDVPNFKLDKVEYYEIFSGSIPSTCVEPTTKINNEKYSCLYIYWGDRKYTNHDDEYSERLSINTYNFRNKIRPPSGIIK